MAKKTYPKLIKASTALVQLNWAGLECHPTDDYVHWTSKDPQGEMIKLRESYNLILTATGYSTWSEDYIKNELDTLLNAAYRKGSNDEAENTAGESL